MIKGNASDLARQLSGAPRPPATPDGPPKAGKAAATPAARPARDANQAQGQGRLGAAAAAAMPPLPFQVEDEHGTTEMSEGDEIRAGNDEAALEMNEDWRIIQTIQRRRSQIHDFKETLPAEARQQFDALLEAVKDTDEATGVQSAQFELEEMAIRGDLTPEVIGALHRLATQPVAPELLALDPQAQARILGETIRQVSHMGAVQQDPSFETCGVNAIEQEFSSSNPAAYVDFIADLVSQGEARLPGQSDGASVSLDLENVKLPLDSSRSLTSTIFQQSVRAAYAEPGDRPQDPITADQFNRMLADMDPTRDRQLVGVAPDQADEAMASVTPPTIMVIKAYGDDGSANAHAVTVTEMEDGMVTFNDPYGAKIGPIPVEEFQQELLGVVVDTGQLAAGGSEVGDIGADRVRFRTAPTDGVLMGGGRSLFSAAPTTGNL